MALAVQRMSNFDSADLIYGEALFSELGITKEALDAVGEVEFE